MSKKSQKLKKSQKSKTVKKLQKVHDILKKPDSDTPKKWVSWLHRYTFPRKYVVLMILSGLLGSMTHPVTRNIIFITLGKYFPTHARFLGKMQLALETAVDHTRGNTTTLVESVKNFPSLWASHVVGVTVGNPKNIVIADKKEEIAETLATVVTDFFTPGLRMCKIMAKDAVKLFTDNDELKELLYANILDERYKDKVLKYASSEGIVSPIIKHQRLIFWTVKACELDAKSKLSGPTGTAATSALKYINERVIPGFT
jgi:hypothetical protein